MAFKRVFTLKDGRKVVVRGISPKENVRALLKHINQLVAEDGYLMVDRRVSLAEEKKWLKENVDACRKGKMVHLVAGYNGQIAGDSSARLDKGREERNAVVGIAVSKGFRWQGLGEFMLRAVISEAKRRLKPAMIYLTAAKPNRAAIDLYRRVGFRQVAVLPKWMDCRGKRIDKIVMVLKK
jgi:ribosomal protein S18 acetylase RimI-like enzyme